MPNCFADMFVVPEPIKGSYIVSPGSRPSFSIECITALYEKPAGYVNHEWTGALKLSLNVPHSVVMGFTISTGDTIELGQTIQDSVVVYVDGIPAFAASIGKLKGRYAVKIIEEWDGGNEDGRQR